jgi:hypothetical protein
MELTQVVQEAQVVAVLVLHVIQIKVVLHLNTQVLVEEALVVFKVLLREAVLAGM